MKLYLAFNDFATDRIMLHISSTKVVPRTFLRTFTVDMLYEYSKAMELVMHRQSPEESVNTED